MERGHPVRLSAQREQLLKSNALGILSGLRPLADRDVRAPSYPRVSFIPAINRSTSSSLLKK
jgi:hypothetical protein